MNDGDWASGKIEDRPSMPKSQNGGKIVAVGSRSMQPPNDQGKLLVEVRETNEIIVLVPEEEGRLAASNLLKVLDLLPHK